MSRQRNDGYFLPFERFVLEVVFCDRRAQHQHFWVTQLLREKKVATQLTSVEKLPYKVEDGLFGFKDRLELSHGTD